MAKKLCALDAGHAGFNKTPGKRTPDGEYEWDFNNKVVKAAEAKLKANGVDVIRIDDASGKTDVGLTARTNKANNAGADVYVSVHHNANTGKWGTWTGTETFTYLGSQSESERLAKEVQSRLVKAYGLRDRGLKKANFAVVRQTKMPAILTEGGYMDSSIDIKKLRDDKVLKAAGEAIADGVLAYFGMSSSKSSVKKEETAQAAPTKASVSKKPTESAKVTQIKKIQSTLNSRYGLKIGVDGIPGPETNKAIVKGLQKEANSQFGAGLSVDGIPGPKTYAGLPTVRPGAKGNVTWLIQAILYIKGYDINGVDSIYGGGLEEGVRKFQKDNGLKSDAIIGQNTWKKLLG